MTEIISLEILQLEYMIIVSRAKAAMFRDRFSKLFSKVHNRGWVYRNIINGYNNWRTDLVLSFLKNCEKDYIIREHRLMRLKEEIISKNK